ncbi:MAG: hypothetical protein HN704_16395 [Bacteroidetes bacterium]|jgi:hypothetical protein|nr:hypothetical protein [Bacteroidota bacterium]MBT6687246.1 hypothetical protein [Bacteroidota bacterium]MBT7144019.1 hypothetical protein [Bacteroidota bacterium]MBT7493178.1 hypothetical protein [Bacteroidota bacterium]
MKIIKSALILAFIFSFNNHIFSQNEENEKDCNVNLREFIQKQDVVKVKDEVYIGKINGKNSVGMRFYAVDYYQLNDSLNHLKGMKITIEQKRDEAKYQISSYIDFEQLTEIDSFLANINAEASTWKKSKKPYSEIVFNTKDNFELKISQSGKKQNGYATISKEKFKLTCSFGYVKKNLKKLVSIFDEADEILNPKVSSEEVAF